MFGKVLRTIGIVLLGVTAVITVLSGMGTTCVAIDAAQYGMDAITSYQWLYLFYVLAGIVIGVMGIRATVALAKGRPEAYRAALVALLLGLITGGLHMATSRALRGSSMPLDFIVYATGVTLGVFLLLRQPGIWNPISRPGEDGGPSSFGAGVALIVSGITILTVQFWAGDTHMINGVNYADVWHTQLALVGWLAALAGGALLYRQLPAWPSPRRLGSTTPEEAAL